MGWRDRAEKVTPKKTLKPGGFDKGPSVNLGWRARAEQIEEDPFPTLPPAVMAGNPEKAKKLFDSYEAAGKDPGYESVTVMTPEGSKQLIRPKSYLGKYKPAPLEVQKAFREKEDAYRKKKIQERTTVFDQAMEGLTRPTEELLSGAATIITDDPKYMEGVGAGKLSVPFEDLSGPQQTAYAMGTVLGYAMPGHYLNLGAKGLVKLGLKASGKEAAAKVAQKKAVQYAQKVVGKTIPTNLGKEIVGSYSAKFIKNAPTLALEGFAWEGIASGGDPEAAMHGAIMFATAGPAVEAGFMVAGKKLFPKKVPRREQVMRILEGKAETPPPKVQKQVVATKPEDPFTRPKGLNDAEWNKVKQVNAYRMSAINEAEIEFAQASLQKKVVGYKKDLARVQAKRDQLTRRRDKIYQAIEKKGNIEVYYPPLPKTIDQIKLPFGDKQLSDIGRELMRDKFGNIEGLHAAAAEIGNDYLTVLIKAGFTQEQAALINRSLTVQNPVLRKLTPTDKVQIKVKHKDAARLNKQIERLEKLEHNQQVRIAGVTKNSVYNPNADVELLTKTTKDRLSAEKFQRKTLDAGIDIVGIKTPKFYNFREWLNYTERHSMIEAETGIPMGQITMDLIEAEYRKSHMLKASEAFKMNDHLQTLRNHQVSGEQAWEWFHYIRTNRGQGAKTPVWDPRQLKMKEYTIPEYKGEAPAKEVQEALIALRKLTDWNHDMIVKSGQEIGYTPGYVSIKPKVGFFTTTAAVPTKGLGKAGLLERRTMGLIPKEERALYHTDFYELMPIMHRDSVNAATFSPVIDKVNTVDWMLRAAGQSKRADQFLRYTARAMGNKNVNETIKVISMDLVNKNKNLVEKLSEVAGPKDQTLAKDVGSALYEMMYNSYIGLSKAVLPKQFFQPELVGAAEIGLKNVEFGKIKAYSPVFRKKTKEALDRVRERLYPEAFNYDMMGEVQRKWLKMLVKMSNLPGVPGMKAFTALDRKNRETMFLGAVHQFENAAKKGGEGLNRIMEDLLPAERVRIMEAFEKHGSREAMDQYGLIRAKRANYAYTMAERAEVFSEGLGRYVPFVHWGANQWMRHLDNVGLAMKGKPGPLSARIAYAVGGTIAVQQLLNEKFYPTVLETGAGKLEVSSGLPQASMLGMGEIDPATALKGVATGDINAWLRYYKKVDGDVLAPQKIWATPKRLKKQRKLKGDITDVIKFTENKKRRR